MKNLFVLAITGLIFISNARAEKIGAGLMLGNPTGLSGKYWLNGEHAIDGGLGLSIGSNAEFNLHSDYLLHKNGALVFNEVYPLDLYFGVGGRMEFGDDIELGVRVPVGLAHMFSNPDADVFAELAPIIDFIGRRGLEISLALGARYYFK